MAESPLRSRAFVRRLFWSVFPVFLLALAWGAIAFGKPIRKAKRPVSAKPAGEASPTVEASPSSNVVASPVITLFSDPGDGPGTASTTPLRRARDLLVAGQEPQAVEYLRQVIASASDRDLGAPTIGKQEPEIRRLLADLLTTRATTARGTGAFETLPADRADEVQGLLREARDVEPYALERWRVYLETLGGKDESQAILAAEGQALFTRFGQGLASASLSPWRPTLERQESIFVRLNLPLERLACLELLARIPGIPESTGATARGLREELLKRRREFLDRLDWLIVRGEAWEAEILLAHLGRLDGENPMLGKLSQRLQVVKRCQELLLQVSMAVRDGDLAKATLLAKQVLDVDARNPHALEYLKKIEELQRGPRVPGASGKDRLASLRKELRQRLKDAEAREDLSAVRKTLKEFIFWAIAEPAHRERLRQVEAELMDSRFHLEERWKDAQELFRKESWDKLRRLLNRNPALGEDPKRVFEFWEMNLVCDYVQERMEGADLTTQVANLEKKQPKSFWALWLRMRLAMDRREYPAADEAYFKAVALQPEHPALKAPGRVLWAQRNGWKIIPFILLLFFYILGKSLPAIVGWVEELAWRLNAALIRVAPGLALRWLESRFGAVREGEPRLRLFRLLTKSAFAANQPAKGARYAELLLEMAPRDQIGIEALGRHLLTQPVLDVKRIDIITAFAMMQSDDRVVLEKAGKAVVAARAIGSDVVPLLKRYLNAFPEDGGMIDHLAGLYQTLRPSEVGRDGLELMERAWRISRDETLWVGIWRVQVACGLFDRAREFLSEAAQAGKAPSPMAMLEAYEQELLSEMTGLQRALAGSDRMVVASALKRIPELRYLPEKQAGMILEPLESLSFDEDTGTKYLAQKARDHAREAARQSGHFRRSIAEFQIIEQKAVPGESRQETGISPQVDSPAPGPQKEEASAPVVTADEPAMRLSGLSQEGAEGATEEFAAVDMTSEAAQNIDAKLFADLDMIAASPELPEAAYFEGPFAFDLFSDLEAAASPVQPQNAVAPALLAESAESEVLSDTPALPVLSEEPLGETAKAQTEPTLADDLESLGRALAEVGETLDQAGVERLQALIDQTGVDDLGAWEAWLKGPIALGLLQTAVRSLGRLRTPLLTPILLRFAGHPHPRVRANVIEGLEANGDPQAIPTLSGFLRDQDNRIRANAIKALQSFDLPSVIDELERMVEDTRVQMRDSAIYVLRGLKTDPGTRMLVRLLSDGEPTIRRNAIRAMAQQGRAENLEPLRAHLRIAMDAEELDLCEKAIRALAGAAHR